MRGLRLAIVAAAALAVLLAPAPRPAAAEWFADLFAGVSLTQDADLRLTSVEHITDAAGRTCVRFVVNGRAAYAAPLLGEHNALNALAAIAVARRFGIPEEQIAPALEQISDELGGRVTVAKLNIEESPTTPSRYGVRGIPTMMLFKGGQMTSMKVGAMPKQKILEWLSEAGVPVQTAV